MLSVKKCFYKNQMWLSEEERDGDFSSQMEEPGGRGRGGT